MGAHSQRQVISVDSSSSPSRFLRMHSVEVIQVLLSERDFVYASRISRMGDDQSVCALLLYTYYMCAEQETVLLARSERGEQVDGLQHTRPLGRAHKKI